LLEFIQEKNKQMERFNQQSIINKNVAMVFGRGETGNKAIETFYQKKSYLFAENLRNGL
jgi:hypothetical protein